VTIAIDALDAAGTSSTRAAPRRTHINAGGQTLIAVALGAAAVAAVTLALPIVDQRSRAAPSGDGPDGEVLRRLALAAAQPHHRKDEIARASAADAGEEAAWTPPRHFRVAITPYYFSLIDREHPSCPVRMQVIPRARELEIEPGDLSTRWARTATRPPPASSTAIPTAACCWPSIAARSTAALQPAALVGQEESPISREGPGTRAGLHPAHARHPRRSDLGRRSADAVDRAPRGDHRALRAIPHVEIVRIGTRVPVVLPMRVDDELCAMLKKYHPLYVNTHFNHPKELTPRARAACEKLADAGIPIGNQTVLLRGVNSSVRVLRKLFTELLRCRVRPYYLFQGDVAAGTSHLRTSVETASR
jgi:lysine 2,3-aminomutase